MTHHGPNVHFSHRHQLCVPVPFLLNLLQMFQKKNVPEIKTKSALKARRRIESALSVCVRRKSMVLPLRRGSLPISSVWLTGAGRQRDDVLLNGQFTLSCDTNTPGLFPRALNRNFPLGYCADG